MHRIVVAVVAVLVTAAPGFAQSYPGDPGAGVQRGIEQVNNSGQVGAVTLFGGGASSRIDVELKGTPDGRVQSVRLYRGPSCDDLAPRPQYFLTDMRHGSSTTRVQTAEDKLLSGNYNLVVFSSNAAGARATACGHLYQ